MSEDTEQTRRHEGEIKLHERLVTIENSQEDIKRSMNRMAADMESEKLVRASRNAGLDAKFAEVQKDINDIKTRIAVASAVENVKKNWLGVIYGMCGGIFTALITALVLWWFKRVTPMK